VKREDGEYIIGKPVYDTEGTLYAWLDQNGSHIMHFPDDDIIGSIDRIEERKWARQQKGVSESYQDALLNKPAVKS
jgi:hypothetical protein